MNAHADSSGLAPEKGPNYLFLLIALIAFVLLLPLQSELEIPGGREALIAFLTIVLISGVNAVCHTRSTKILGTSLWMLVFALNAITIAIEDQTPLWHGLDIASDLIAIFALVAMIIFILNDVFIGEISRDRLRGAGAAYLLMGIAFGLVFHLIDQAFANSFRGGSEGPIEAQESFFYSFVTLTTLGYGDITPARPFAQAAAYLESCIGQFYLTVLVAFLVGKRLAAIASNSAKT